MKQTLIDIYILISCIVAISTALLQIQPALFFIEFLAPNPGDKYNLVFVIIVTCMLFIIPFLVLLSVLKLLRNTSAEVIQTDRTGVFVNRKKSFTGAIVGIPICINSKKVGIVDNGKTIFFDIPIGTFTIQAGIGKQASEKLEEKIMEKDQLQFELYLNKEGLFPKIELTLVENDNKKTH
jgi:hypothetical protein